MIRNLTGKDSKSYKSVFFDLDGTITESGEGCINGLKYMFKKIGYTGYDEKKLKAFIGPPMRDHLAKAYGFSEKQAEEAYTIYREYYSSKGLFENRLYDGIMDTINKIKLSGKAVYIATSKPESQTLRIAERFGLSSVFSGIFASKPELGIFNKIQVLSNAIKELGAVQNAVMVGDRIYDIQGGQHVGFDTVGVLYGYGDSGELEEAGCDYIVDSVKDLGVLLGRN